MIRTLELRRSNARDKWIVPLGSVAIGVMVIVSWAIAASSPLGFVIASPPSTLRVLWDGLFGPDPFMVPHLEATFAAVAIGYAAAVIVGMGWGIFLGTSWYWRAVLEPLILSTYSVPKVILFPVFLMMLGIGLQSAATMAFIHALFPIIVNVMGGVKEVNPTVVKVGKAFRASPWTFVTKIYFPAVALSLVVGLRMGFSLSIIGVVMSELFAAREGLGRLIMERYGVFDIPGIYAPLLLLFAVALTGNLLFWVLEKRLRSVR